MSAIETGEQPQKVTDHVRVEEAVKLFKNSTVAHLCRIIYPDVFPRAMNMNDLLKVSKLGLSYGNKPEELRVVVQTSAEEKQVEIYQTVNRLIEEIATDNKKANELLNRMSALLSLGMEYESDLMKARQAEADEAKAEAERKAAEEAKAEAKRLKREAKNTKKTDIEEEVKVEEPESSESSELPEVSSSSSSSIPQPKTGRGKGGRGKGK